MKKLLLLANLVLSLAANGTSLNRTAFSCGKNGSLSQFTVFVDPTGASFIGVYTRESSKDPIYLKCAHGKQTGSIKQNLVCVEKRAGEGRLLVSVETGGFTNQTIANVFIEQMFPVAAQYIESLTCK